MAGYQQPGGGSSSKIGKVRFRGECVAKLLLRPRANADSVGLRGESRERSMMGRREGGQGQFRYAFDLDKVVPPDHLLQQIDSVIDLSWVHKKLAPYYSDTGRPSIDPVLMIRMLIVGYVFALRSERRICAEVAAPRLRIRAGERRARYAGFASTISATRTSNITGLSPAPL